MAESDASKSKITHTVVDEINVDQLYDYTKFHIGLYAALVTLTVALLKLGSAAPEEGAVIALDGAEVLQIQVVAALFALAGAFGGIVCTNCLRFPEGAQISRHEGISFWGMKPRLSIQFIANLEHGTFWAGIVVALSTIFFGEIFLFKWIAGLS